MIHQPRVLVVDDSPTTCLFVASTLEQAGYDVEIALKGQEGLSRITRFQPSCLILDVVLPDISGYAICRYAQQLMSRHPLYIILISAKKEPLDRNYGLRQGANCYLPKPFTAQELVQAVWEGVPLPTPRTVFSTLAPTQDGDAPVKLSELLPRRASSESVMRTNSPFTSVRVIEDEQAHRLYTAIDGRKTLAELSAVTGLEKNALTRAARVLLKENRIQMYDGAGRLVERPL